MLALLLIPLTALAQQACPEPTTLATMTSELDAAERAYTAKQPQDFAAAIEELVLVLPCFEALIPPVVAARYHRLRGLDLFVARNTERATMSFTAARRLEPDYQFPLEMIPENHPVRPLYAGVEPGSGKREHVRKPSSGALYFDGTAGLDRPLARASLVQVTDTGGSVLATRYLFPTDPMPAYAVTTAAARRERARVGFLVGAGGALVAAGALFGGATASYQKFYDTAGLNSTDPSELERLRTQTNGLMGGAVAAAGLSLAGAFAAALVAGPVTAGEE